MNPQPKTFTWTEFLVLIAVIGFLAAVLVPMMTHTDHGRQRTVDASNLRQIGQASLIYANDNREELPGLHLTQDGEIDEEVATPNIHAVAAALARKGGLNDSSIWKSAYDRHPDVDYGNWGVILEPGTPRTLHRDFARSSTSFQYVAGLNTGMPSTTPIAFTRGLRTDGTWTSDREVSVYGADGGHIVFLGGNVSFHRDLRDGSGALLATDSSRTANILKAIGEDSRIFSTPATETSAVDGMPGLAP